MYLLFINTDLIYVIYFKEQDMMKFNPNAILFGLKNNEV